MLGPQDPHRAAKLRKLRALLRHFPSDETAMVEDKVDVNTNPHDRFDVDAGGQQAEVVTPGTNTERYLTGSLNWRTGEVVL